MLLSVGKAVSPVIICIFFYFLNDWIWFTIFLIVALVGILPIYISKVFESVYYIIASTGNIDKLKNVLDKITLINDDDPLEE